MQGKQLSVIVELRHKTLRKELTLRGNYNTGHEVQAIPNEICGCSRCEQGQPEVQQGQVFHLLLAEALGRQRGLPTA